MNHVPEKTQTQDRSFDEPLANSPTAPTPGDPSVTQLIQRVQAGCPDSREALFALLRDYFKHLAQRHHNQQLKAKLGVSDIVQQSMIRAVESFETFEGRSEGELRSWLKTLLINEIRQSVRNWSRQRRDVTRETCLPGDGMENDWLVSDPNPTPQSLSIRQEQVGQLRSAIDRLPQVDRQVIRLRGFDRLSFEEVGRQMNRSPTAAAKLWYRAIVKLQRDLQAEGYGNEY